MPLVHQLVGPAWSTLPDLGSHTMNFIAAVEQRTTQYALQSGLGALVASGCSVLVPCCSDSPVAAGEVHTACRT
jgi:hypothetical protein